MPLIAGPGQIFWNDDAKIELLTQAVVTPAAVGPLHGGKVGLIAAPIVPTFATDVADITEPSWLTYAQQAITWGTPYQSAQGEVDILGGLGTFTFGSDAAGAVIYGWFVIFSDLTLAYVYMLNNALPIVAAGTLEVPVVLPWQGI